MKVNVSLAFAIPLLVLACLEFVNSKQQAPRRGIQRRGVPLLSGKGIGGLKGGIRGVGTGRGIAKPGVPLGGANGVIGSLYGVIGAGDPHRGIGRTARNYWDRRRERDAAKEEAKKKTDGSATLPLAHIARRLKYAHKRHRHHHPHGSDLRL